MAQIPNDALALLSDNNGSPLRYRYSEDPALHAPVVERGDGFIRFDNNITVDQSACYLGAIVSANRSIIYWENDTEPLP